MEPGRGFDALIEVKMFGNPCRQALECCPDCRIWQNGEQIPDDSTKIVGVWLVLQELAQRNLMLFMKHDSDCEERKWTCWASWPVDNDLVVQYDCARHVSEAPAHATCLAALKAVDAMSGGTSVN